MKQDEHDRICVRELVIKREAVTFNLKACLSALKESLIYNFLVLEFYSDMKKYVHK